MPSEKLRTLVGLLIAAAGIAASCSRYPRATEEPAVPGRHLGESTASGNDPNRPVVQSVDTQNVSATLRRAPVGPTPRPGPASPGKPAPVPMPAPAPPNAAP